MRAMDRLEGRVILMPGRRADTGSLCLSVSSLFNGVTGGGAGIGLGATGCCSASCAGGGTFSLFLRDNLSFNKR